MTEQQYQTIMAKYPDLESEVIRRMRERDARKADCFPMDILVGYDTSKHPDPWNEQDGPYAVTCHPSILRAVGGEAILVILHNRNRNRSLKVMLTPIHGSPIMETVGDLQQMAKNIWPTAHPITQKEWEELLEMESLYTALNDLKKMFPKLDLPDIRTVGYYIDTDSPYCLNIWRVDRQAKTTQKVPIAEMGEENFILCITDR